MNSDGPLTSVHGFKESAAQKSIYESHSNFVINPTWDVRDTKLWCFHYESQAFLGAEMNKDLLAGLAEVDSVWRFDYVCYANGIMPYSAIQVGGGLGH